LWQHRTRSSMSAWPIDFTMPIDDRHRCKEAAAASTLALSADDHDEPDRRADHRPLHRSASRCRKRVSGQLRTCTCARVATLKDGGHRRLQFRWKDGGDLVERFLDTTHGPAEQTRPDASAPSVTPSVRRRHLPPRQGPARCCAVATLSPTLIRRGRTFCWTQRALAHPRPPPRSSSLEPSPWKPRSHVQRLAPPWPSASGRGTA